MTLLFLIFSFGKTLSRWVCVSLIDILNFLIIKSNLKGEYSVFCGLDTVLNFLQSFRFSDRGNIDFFSSC